jgi:hypothetical protein
MIFKSPYDTTALFGFPREKIDKILNVARAGGALRAFKGNWEMFMDIPALNEAFIIVDTGSPHLDNLPALKHPYVTHDQRTGQDTIFIDARTMLVKDRITEQFVNRSSSRVDFQMMLTRAKLQRMWMGEKKAEIRSCSAVPAIVFARWVSSTLSQKFMLDPREQETLEIISGYYYHTLFNTALEADHDKVVGYLSRHLGMHAERCYEVIPQIKEDIQGVPGLCKAFTEVTGSIRLKDFNAGHLYAALGMGYFGMMGKELTAVALEHPPTWITMLLYAVDDAMYKKSAIGTMLDKGSLRQKSKDFLLAMTMLINGATDADD